MSESSKKSGRPKGLPKTGGRKKGSSNKVSKSIRARLEKELENHIDTIGTLIMKIADPKDRLAAITSVLPYIAPKMQSIDMTAKESVNVSVAQNLKELDHKFNKKHEDLTKKKLEIVNFN